MPLPNNYFATRAKPYPVLESDLDSINNYLNTIADEVRPPSRGGTGLSSYTIGDIPYASATQTLSTLALATDGHYLTSNGSVPQYRQIVQNEVSGLGDTETPTFDEVTATTKLNTDTIAEGVGADGVTIDGVKLKDGGATFSSPVDMGSQKITALSGPNVSTDAANKGYVDSLIQGLDWNESVLDIVDFTASEPAGPSTGDRYINTGTGASSITVQSVTANYIYEWNGVDWTETIPTEGYAVWVEDEDVLYVFNGSSWVKFGTTVTHTNLLGLDADDHTQYYNAARLSAWGGDTNIITLGEVITGIWSATQLIADKVPDHDNLNNVAADEHIDWVVPDGKNVHIDNIQNGTVSQEGVVQTINSVSSSSTTLVPVAANVKSAYDIGNHSHSYKTYALIAELTPGSGFGNTNNGTKSIPHVFKPNSVRAVRKTGTQTFNVTNIPEGTKSFNLYRSFDGVDYGSSIASASVGGLGGNGTLSDTVSNIYSDNGESFYYRIVTSSTDWDSSIAVNATYRDVAPLI